MSKAAYVVCHDQNKCGCGNRWSVLPFKTKEDAEGFRKISTCVTEPTTKLSKEATK